MTAPDDDADRLLYDAWGLIANAGWDAATGDVTGEKHPDWHDAAVDWRDRYHARLSAMNRRSPDDHQ